MRWFTDAAYDADDDATWDRMLAGYTSHLSALAPSLPADLAALATEPRLHLHDARFREVRVDTDAEEVEIIFLTGGLDVGYRQLTLAFGGAAIALAEFARPDSGWRHQLRDDGRLDHIATAQA